jgi:hypothetical protein
VHLLDRGVDKERLLNVDRAAPLAGIRVQARAPRTGRGEPDPDRSDQRARAATADEAVGGQHAAHQPGEPAHVERSGDAAEVCGLKPMDVAKAGAVAAMAPGQGFPNPGPALFPPVRIEEIHQSGTDDGAAEEVACTHAAKGYKRVS